MAKTYGEAIKLLPADAKWSSSFGSPGEGGYSEYHRTPDGKRYVIANGSYLQLPFEFNWTCEPA